MSEKVVELPPRAVVALESGGFGVVRNDAAGTVTPAPGIKSQEDADAMNASWGVGPERRDALLLAAGRERPPAERRPAPAPFTATFELLQHVAVFSRIMERPFDAGSSMGDDPGRHFLVWRCEHDEALALLAWKDGGDFRFCVAEELSNMKRYALIGYCCEEGITLLEDGDDDPEAAGGAAAEERDAP